jgi:hypothetical protein
MFGDLTLLTSLSDTEREADLMDYIHPNMEKKL